MPGGMSCSWERRLAENLTNADHMRDLRQRIDTEHEERLRRRQREREDAEVSRAARKLKTPTASDKFTTRSYDRPWAVRKPEIRKGVSSPSDSSNASSRNSGSLLPYITHGAQGQSSETRTPQTTRQQRHPGNKCLSKKDSLLANKNKCVGTKTRQSVRSGSLACHQGNRFQYTSSQTATSPCSLVGQSKPPLTHSRESAPVPQDQRLPWPRPRLPSLRSTFSWTASDLDTDRQSLPDIWDISDMDRNTSSTGSSIQEEEEVEDEEDDSEGDGLYHSIISSCASSTSSTRSVSTDSWLSSAQPADTPLSTSFSSSSSSSSRSTSTSLRSPLLDLTPRTRFSPLDALVRDLPCLEPITSGSEEEEELEEELSTWQAGQLGRGNGVVRWRGPLSRPDLVPLPTASTAAAVASRADVAELLSPHALARLSMPVASPLLQAAGAQEVGRDSSRSSGTESGTPSPSPSTPAFMPVPVPGRVASRTDALAIMDLLGTALTAMRVMRQEIQRGNGHGNNRSDGMEAGNDSNGGNSTSVDGTTAGAPETKPQASPETLHRITQSLLEESDEDVEEQCRICQCGTSTATNPLLSPCRCSGSLQYIHHDCLRKWLETKIESGADRPAVTTCELCKTTLKLDLNDFDLDECFRQTSQAQRELGGPGWDLLLQFDERFLGFIAAFEAHDATAQYLRQWVERTTERASSMRRGPGTVATTSSDSES